MITETKTHRLIQTIVNIAADHGPDIYATRDAEIDGTVGDVIDLWCAHPRWCSNRDDDTPNAKGGCWINPDEVAYEQCYLGPHTVEAVRKRFGTIPDTDHECVKYAGRGTSEVQ